MNISVLLPTYVDMLHLSIPPDGQNIVPNVCPTVPDQEGAIRCLHLSAVLHHPLLCDVPPTTPCSQLAVVPILLEMQLDVGVHLLLRGSSPLSAPSWGNINRVPYIVDGICHCLAMGLLLLCHTRTHGSLPLTTVKTPQVRQGLPVVFITLAHTHARCTS